MKKDTDRMAEPQPPRTWRPMALGAAGVLLLAALAWFVGAVVVPLWQVRAGLEHVGWFTSGPVTGMIPGGDELTVALGGPEAAARKLGLYLRMPEVVAPEKTKAAQVLCGIGPEAERTVTLLLHDPHIPSEIRIEIAGFLAWQPDDMEDGGWKMKALVAVLDDPCGRLRVAAACIILYQASINQSDEFDAAAQQLIVRLKDNDVQVRRAAAAAAAAVIGFVDQLESSTTGRDFFSIAKPALEAALNDPDPKVRASAAEALRHAPKPVRRFSGEEANKAE